MSQTRCQDINGKKLIVELPAERADLIAAGFPADAQLRDQYGNLRWELLEDGSIVEANLAPTQEQVNEYTSRSRLEKVTAVFLKIVAEAITGTATPLESWREIDQKLREKLT